MVSIMCSRNSITALLSTYGLMGFRQSISESGMFFSSLRAALGPGPVLPHLAAHGILPGRAKGSHHPLAKLWPLRPQIPIPAAFPAIAGALASHLSTAECIRQQGTLYLPAFILHDNESSSAPKNTFDIKALVIHVWHTYIGLETHLSVRANNGARCAEHYLCQELARHEYACERVSMLGTNVFTLDGIWQGLNVLDGSNCDNLRAWRYRDMLSTNRGGTRPAAAFLAHVCFWIRPSDNF